MFFSECSGRNRKGIKREKGRPGRHRKPRSRRRCPPPLRRPSARSATSRATSPAPHTAPDARQPPTADPSPRPTHPRKTPTRWAPSPRAGSPPWTKPTSPRCARRALRSPPTPRSSAPRSCSTNSAPTSSRPRPTPEIYSPRWTQKCNASSSPPCQTRSRRTASWEKNPCRADGKPAARRSRRF